MLHQCTSATDVNRRELLAISLGWLIFWHRGTRKLAGIEFRVINGHHSGRRFLQIHGNETTARDVLIEHMKSASGRAFLIENHDRYVQFKGGRLDPNRMFSREGAERNLRMLNPDWPEAQLISASLMLDRHRHELVNAVRPVKGDVLIAVHNNSSSYSVEDEVAISDRTALNNRANPHEFCLCTDPADFNRLSQGTENVVLQNRAPKVDDGSLSRLAAREGFRYVNIEVGMGRRAEQQRLLQWVDSTLA
jgi:hypothetical protein